MCLLCKISFRSSVGDSRNSIVISLSNNSTRPRSRILNDVFNAVDSPLSPGTSEMLPGIVGGAEAVEVGSTSSHLACHDPPNLSPVQATLDPVRVARGCQGGRHSTFNSTSYRLHSTCLYSVCNSFSIFLIISRIRTLKILTIPCESIYELLVQLDILRL